MACFNASGSCVPFHAPAVDRSASSVRSGGAVMAMTTSAPSLRSSLSCGMSTPSKNLALMFRILFFLSGSRITRIWGLHGLPPTSSHPLCPSHHLRPLPYLRFPNPHSLPYLRRLYLLHPPPYLPTQSAFIRVICLIRDLRNEAGHSSDRLLCASRSASRS